MTELDIIDKNYKLIIEFKAFVKFVKKYRKGDAYEESSCSSTSEAFEEFYREEYRALDTTHQGYLKEDALRGYFAKKWNLIPSSSIIDTNINAFSWSDDKVTFKSWCKF